MKDRPPFQQELWRLLGACSLLVCAGCNSSPPTVPIQKPFGLGQGGESVEFDFRVKETYGHDVRLDIYFHSEEGARERETFINRLGERIFADGSVRDVGILITLRVRVQSIEVQGPPVNFDETTDRIGLVYASRDYATKRVLQINHKQLEPGTYRIRVDNLHPVPDLANRTVRIAIHHSSQGK